MIRRATTAWAMLAVVAAAGLYLLKQEVRGLEAQVRTLDRAILDNQEAVHVLEAEWAYLNQPARLDDLGRRLLGLAPLRGKRIVDLGAVTGARAVPVAAALEAGR